MTNQEIIRQLENITSSEDFAGYSRELAQTWIPAGVGLEAIDPILKFMEGHPSIDYGEPGGLVHFMERFCRKGYEEKLIASITRKPISHTIWMLNRLINGTEDPALRQKYISLLEQSKSHPLADHATIEAVDFYLG